MTVSGTSVAAGVAQTAHQAQQVSRSRDGRASQSAAAARRMRELLDSHLRALEEGDEFESPAQLHIDSQLPDQPSPDYLQPQPESSDQDEPTAGGESASPPGPPSQQRTLYRHLDVQA